MNQFLDMETGQPITFEECLRQTREFNERTNKARYEAPPNDSLVIIEWVATATGYKGHGSPVTLTVARAVTNRPDLQPGSRWSSHGIDHHLKLVE